MARDTNQQTRTNGRGEASAPLLMRAASALLNRSRLAAAANKAFGGMRDYECALGYKEILTPEDYRGRYDRWGIARRIVDSYPGATWAGGASLVEDEDPEVETQFESAVSELFDRLDAWSRLRRVDVLAGLGRYSVLLIGAAGDPVLSNPLPEMSGPESVLYLQPIGEDRSHGITFDADPSSPRFGLPLTYQLSIGTASSVAGGSARTSTVTRTVHWTRVIHVADGLLDDDVYGVPRLRPVWNYLDDLIKVVGGGAEAAWMRADPGLQLNADKDLQLSEQEVKAMEDDVEDYRHELTRVVRTRGIEMNVLDAQVTAFGGNATSIISLISAATGIPQRILIGSERGELSSVQDRANWNERIAARQVEFATPIVMDLTDRLIDHGALPEPAEKRVQWPDSFTLDEKEKAEVASQLATANQRQFASERRVIATADEIRDRVFGWAPLVEVTGGDGEEEVVEEEDVEVEVPEGDEVDDDTLALAQQFVDLDDIDADDLDDDWRSVHVAADRSFNKLMSIFVATAIAMSTRLGADDRLLDAAASRSTPVTMVPVTEVVDRVYEAARPEVRDVLLDTLREGADQTLSAARGRDSFVRSAQLDVEFDAENPRAVEWAELNAAVLITEVSDETKAAIRELVVEALRDGVTAAEIARRIRELIGLTRSQRGAVASFIEELIAAEPGDLVTRFPPSPTVRRLPGLRVRVPREGLSIEDVNRVARRYSRMLLNLRARTIARTEVIRAANAGQLELWRQAQASGELPADAHKLWIVSPDDAVCPICLSLEGQTVPINEKFQIEPQPGVPDGDAIDGPVAHPNCRCGMAIATNEDVRAWRRRQEARVESETDVEGEEETA